jgi:hypothetical protein
MTNAKNIGEIILTGGHRAASYRGRTMARTRKRHVQQELFKERGGMRGGLRRT